MFIFYPSPVDLKFKKMRDLGSLMCPKPQEQFLAQSECLINIYQIN